ncbi:hypothetical protein D3C71_1479110 [compost metagenome]
MVVTVEGHVTSIQEKTKDDKDYTELMLAQQGEKEQIVVRLKKHVADEYSLFEIGNFTGRLMTWKQREGIGSMVMVD